MHEAFSKQIDIFTEMIVEAIKNSPPLWLSMREKMENSVPGPKAVRPAD